MSDGGGKARFIHTDATREADWEHLVETTAATFGKLDILVNNAGIDSTSAPQSSNWTIVKISSTMGFGGSDGGHPAYHASNGALRLFTKATAVRNGPAGRRINSVHSGFMPAMRSSGPGAEELRERTVRATPMRRNGEPIEAACGVLFLASDNASFVTGTELGIDGGFVAR